MRVYLQNADGTLSEPTSPETISAADCALVWVEIDDHGSAPAQLISKDFQIDLPDFESFKSELVTISPDTLQHPQQQGSHLPLWVNLLIVQIFKRTERRNR